MFSGGSLALSPGGVPIWARPAPRLSMRALAETLASRCVRLAASPRLVSSEYGARVAPGTSLRRQVTTSSGVCISALVIQR
eukprot:2035570-Pyramimonas_sp.AAC.1